MIYFAKAKILLFFADSDTPVEMQKRKIIGPSNNEIDEVKIEWVHQKKNENVSLTGAIKTAQVRIFHTEVKVETPCEFSSDWLEKFKKHHGI